MPAITILRGDFVVRRECEAKTAITAGHLVNFSSDDKLQSHNSSGGFGEAIFAVEQDFLGKDNTQVYAAGDRACYAACPTGTVVWAHLASGQTVAKGEALESNGDGQLIAYSSGYRIARADEDKVSTANGTRFRAEVI